MGPGTHLSLSCKELAFIFTLQNCKLMLSVPPTIAHFWNCTITEEKILCIDSRLELDGDRKTILLKLLLVKSWSKGRVYTCGSTALHVSVACTERYLKNSSLRRNRCHPSIYAYISLCLSTALIAALPAFLLTSAKRFSPLLRKKVKAGSTWLYWICQILPRMWHQYAIASKNCKMNAPASDALRKMPIPTHYTTKSHI